MMHTSPRVGTGNTVTGQGYGAPNESPPCEEARAAQFIVIQGSGSGFTRIRARLMSATTRTHMANGFRAAHDRIFGDV